MAFANWIQDHWAAITSVALALSTLLATIKQAIDSKTHSHNWLDVLIDVLAWVPRPGSVGILGAVNVPGLPSLNKVDKDAGLAATHARHAARHAEKAAIEAKKAIVDATKLGDEVPKPDPPLIISDSDDPDTRPIKVLGLLLLIAMPSCGHLNAKGMAISVAECAAPAALTEVENLSGTIAAILSGNATDWSGQLTALETLAGPFVICAVRAVVANFSAQMVSPVHGQLNPRVVLAVDRGTKFLTGHGGP